MAERSIPAPPRGAMHHVLEDSPAELAVAETLPSPPPPPPPAFGVEPPPPPPIHAELLGRTPTAQKPGRRLLAGTLLVVGGTLGWFVLGPGGGDSALAAHYRRVFTAGDAHDYRMAIHMSGTVGAAAQGEIPLDLTMSLMARERVLDVDGEGNARVRYGIDGIEADVGGIGGGFGLPTDELEFTARIAPDGRVLEVEGLDALFGAGQFGPASDFLGPDSMGPVLPDGKVAPGDTWTEEISQDVPFLDSDLTVTSRNKLLRLKTIDGERAAVIRSEIEMPFDISLDSEDIRGMAQAGGADALTAGSVPDGASMSMSGGAKMTLLQTIVADTGRPIQVTGDGTMDVEMIIGGVGLELPAMSMSISFDVDFSEVPLDGGA